MPTSTVPPPPTTDLAQLLRRLGDGDPAAWTEVVHRYEGLIRHVCRERRMTREQTADVVQTTWLRLFQHAHRIRNADGIRSWLVVTAARECIAVRRQAAREVPADRMPEPAAAGSADDEVGDRLDGLRRHRRLRRAVTMLPTRERRLVELLLEPEPPSYAEISARLEMPVGAIGPVRGRALRRLHSWLADDEAAELAAFASA